MKTLPSDSLATWVKARAKRAGLPDRHIAAYPEIVAKTLEPTNLVDPWLDTFNRIDAMRGKGFIDILLGRRGCGKTQLAACIAMQDIIEKVTSDTPLPLYVKAADLFRHIRSTYSDSETSEVEAMRRYTRCPILIIDEAHERSQSEFEHRTLVNIIDRRYDAMLDTLIVSNHTKKEAAEVLGPSIVSRVHECGEAIECNWGSFRQAVAA